MNETKVKVTSEQLKKWLDENGVKLVGLEKAIGLKSNLLSGKFNKTAYRDGFHRNFSQEMATQVNDGMRVLAEQLRRLIITYSPEDAKIVARHKRYPSCLEKIKVLREWLMIKPFIKKALGWNDARISNILISRSNYSYGNLTEEDIAGINTGIIQIAAALDSFEMLPDS